MEKGNLVKFVSTFESMTNKRNIRRGLGREMPENSEVIVKIKSGEIFVKF